MMEALALLAHGDPGDSPEIVYVYPGFAWWTFLIGVVIGLAVTGLVCWGLGLWHARNTTPDPGDAKQDAMKKPGKPEGLE